jgi:predicted transcriptional regulator
MRTTIRIADDHRERLLKIAAERGDRGYSRIVEEALDRYLCQPERASAPTRAETRAERARVILGWLWEEAAGFIGVARTFRARLRRSTASAS